MRTLILIMILLATALPLSARAQHAETSPGVRDVTFCELARDPVGYNRQFVRLTAFVTHGFEDFSIGEPNCPGTATDLWVWVVYGGKAKSDTIYCCPGEGGRGERQQSLSVEGVPIGLVDDSVFQRFTELLRKEPDTTVRVTLVGAFFSGTKRAGADPPSWGGYGHLGCCSLFAIQKIESFEPHSRTDVDYTAEAGAYEAEGCKWSSELDLREVSLILKPEVAKQAIEEQRLADSGERAWAFTDSRRVAIESLIPFYKAKVPQLKRVKQTPVREVFRWKDGKKSIVVVVTRPYWLNFYSKSSSVAWVSTAIKEVECK